MSRLFDAKRCIMELQQKNEQLRDDFKACLSDYYEQRNKVMRLKATLVRIGILNVSNNHYDLEIDRAIREVNELVG